MKKYGTHTLFGWALMASFGYGAFLVPSAHATGSGAWEPLAANAVTVAGPSVVTILFTAQYTAKVAGTTNQVVAWEVNGVVGGSSTYGTISTSGVYTPPATLPSASKIVITADSNYDPKVSGSVSATIVYPTPVILNTTNSTTDLGHTFVVNIYGNGFMPGASIVIGGKPVEATAIGPDAFQITVSNSSGKASQIAVFVQNPSPASTLSKSSVVTLTPTLVTPTAAARFLDQISFGPTTAMLAQVEQIGLQAELNDQFNMPTTLFSQPPSRDPECPPFNGRCTQSQFLDIAAWGNDQLRQRVAMALSEWWVAPAPVENSMPAYLNTLANDAFTNYRTIMQDATLSPNMGIYLNMLNSPVALQGGVPNENFAREVMQLFTIGLSLLNPDGSVQTDAKGNPIPTYTESQVQAFARAFTGWTWAPANGSSPSAFGFTDNWLRPMMPVESKHDTTAKILLNGTTLPAGQTAEQDLTGALDNIFAHPNLGPFVSRQLIQHLVTGSPSPAYIQRVAEAFDNNGSGVRGDMKAVLTAIFLDPEARAGDTQSAEQADSTPEVNGGHLREPLLWIANLVRGLNATRTNPAITYPFGNFMGGDMGLLEEEPFDQSSVFNYYSPQYLIPETTINAPEFGLEDVGAINPRLNTADAIVDNLVAGLTVNLSAASAIGQNAGNAAGLVDYVGMLFMHSQMPTDMRNVLINAVSTVPATDPQSRAEVAVYLVGTSSQYKIIH